MKALRWYDRKDIRVEDVPEPIIEHPEDVKVKIVSAGICGTDLHEYQNGPVYISKSPHPLTNKKPPIVLGHEAVGVVVDTGKAITRIRKGDRVCFYPVLSCRSCDMCREGKYNYCEKIGFIGLSLDGCFAEYVTVPEYSCVIVPSKVSNEAAAIVEPAAMVVRAVDRAGIRTGDKVVVVGCGPIGLITIQMAKIMGSPNIVALEPLKIRREMAIKMGADFVIDPTAGGINKSLSDAFGGKKADVVFECVGIQKTLDLSISTVASGGKIMVVGIYTELSRINMFDIVNKEISLLGNMGGGGYFTKTLEYINKGRLDLDGLVLAKIDLMNIVAKFDEIIAHKDRFLKVIVTPERS